MVEVSYKKTREFHLDEDTLLVVTARPGPLKKGTRIGHFYVAGLIAEIGYEGHGERIYETIECDSPLEAIFEALAMYKTMLMHEETNYRNGIT